MGGIALTSILLTALQKYGMDARHSFHIYIYVELLRETLDENSQDIVDIYFSDLWFVMTSLL